MKKKNDQKKLTFGRETVRALSTAQLTRVAGGSHYPSDSGCGSDSSDPQGDSGSGSGGGGYISYYP